MVLRLAVEDSVMFTCYMTDESLNQLHLNVNAEDHLLNGRGVDVRNNNGGFAMKELLKQLDRNKVTRK
jgi:hypothetical protein